MEFETLLKIVVALLAAFGIPVAAYAAIVATRAIWVKGEPNSIAAALQDRVDMLEARVAELESGQERLQELEERVDFAERLLARQEPDRLPR